jgi:hypothetical protein
VVGVTALAAICCRACGGTVRAVPGEPLPSCLFCGGAAADLVPVDPPEGIEPPVGAIPFAVGEDDARAAFARFATSSFWYPSDLRSASLGLRRLLLPAWAWSGAVETHWTGLVQAHTRSGKRPVAGSETARMAQVLVPASRTLRLAELTALGRYDEGALGPFDAEGADVPIELSELTRSAARSRAHDEMLVRHRDAIERRDDLVRIRASSVTDDLVGRPVLVPVWIGAYRYGERSYRILVNGQTGRLVGAAPFSWTKAAAVAGGVLLVLAVIVAILLAVASS